MHARLCALSVLALTACAPELPTTSGHDAAVSDAPHHDAATPPAEDGAVDLPDAERAVFSDAAVDDPDAHSTSGACPSLPTAATHVLGFLDFDDDMLPVNGAGDSYPSLYTGETARGDVLLDRDNGVCGNGVAFELTDGVLYAQWNAHRAVGRGFAREFGDYPDDWETNTYDRLAFWLYVPENGAPLAGGGRTTFQFGTFVKRVDPEDDGSDETGGDHYYHQYNIGPTGTWWRVVVDAHPTHRRYADPNADLGVLLHPTAEPAYDYFDTLTRFYMDGAYDRPTSYPAIYRFDEMVVYTAPPDENVDQVASLAATYVPDENRVLLTWNRRKDEMASHEVRYAFSDIHALGWDAATVAPDGTISPPGDDSYNGMVFDSTALPLDGHDIVFLAIRPSGASTFAQMELPLHPEMP